MRVIINALSATHLSARYVLMGHLEQLAKASGVEREYVVLYHSGNRDLRRDFGGNVRWIECPGYTSHWVGRSLWERMALPGLVEELKADLVVMPTGTVISALRIPQISYAMNPVPLIGGEAKSSQNGFKLYLQRKAYKRAMKNADMMFFLSEYMRQIYRSNTKTREKASEIVYAGLDSNVFKAAKAAEGETQKKALQILCVSAMTRHKNIETVIRAVRDLKVEKGVSAHLYLVGPWSENSYRREMEAFIDSIGMSENIDITGYVSREELFKYYAESKVYCLMSRSESFGIPALEAQGFGTPVVGADCSAAAEVCGEGGMYTGPDDTHKVVEYLHKMLTDDDHWSLISRLAVENAAKYRWEEVAKPFFRCFDSMEKKA